MSSDDQVIVHPDEPFLKKESALHKLSKSAARASFFLKKLIYSAQRFRVAELLYEAVLGECVTTKRSAFPIKS
jgi:hypothetical protein